MPASASDDVQATGLDSVAPDLIRQEIQIGFSRGDDPVLVVRFPAGSIAALMLKLAWCSGELSVSIPEKVDLAQPTRLQGVSPFFLNDGRKGLSLRIAGIQIPLVLTNDQLETLKTLLEQVAQGAPDHRLN